MFYDNLSIYLFYTLYTSQITKKLPYHNQCSCLRVNLTGIWLALAMRCHSRWMSALLHAKVKSNRLTIAARRAIPSDSTSHLACNVMCVSERGGKDGLGTRIEWVWSVRVEGFYLAGQIRGPYPHPTNDLFISASWTGSTMSIHRRGRYASGFGYTSIHAFIHS